MMGGANMVLAAAAIAALTAIAEARFIQHPLAMDDYPFLRQPSPSYSRQHYDYEVPRTSALSDNRVQEKRSGNSGGAAEEVETIPYEGDDNDYSPYGGGLNVRKRRARAFQRMRREKELKQLYEKIAREFPFVAKQGLKPGQKVPSLDDLFAMTMFGQPNGR